MAKLVVYTSPARGHLFPLIPTLLALQARGHRVHVRTLAAEVPRLQALGLDASPMAPAIEARELDDWRATSPMGAMGRALTTWTDRAQHEVADLRDALADADAALVDVNAWGALAAAEASGRPFAVFAPYFLNLTLPGRPPFGLGLAPASGLFGRLRDGVIRAVVGWSTRPHVHRLNALRAGLGLPPLASLDQLTAPAHRVLAYTAEPFEYGHGGWPANVRLVGPGVWEPPADPPPPSARPLVLVTCSTEFQDDGQLIEVALAALKDDDVDVIATTGAVDPGRFHAPPNATVVPFAPHGPLLARSVAVVCHGGMGITQKALAAGVPVCVVPWGRDQNDVARHVVVAGAGATVPRGRLTPDRLRAAVHQTIAARPGAQRVAAAFATFGPGRAADVVEELVGPVG
jgi:MGT family glycosyltransferase